MTAPTLHTKVLALRRTHSARAEALGDDLPHVTGTSLDKGVQHHEFRLEGIDHGNRQKHKGQDPS